MLILQYLRLKPNQTISFLQYFWRVSQANMNECEYEYEYKYKFVYILFSPITLTGKKRKEGESESGMMWENMKHDSCVKSNVHTYYAHICFLLRSLSKKIMCSPISHANVYLQPYISLSSRVCMYSLPFPSKIDANIYPD